MMIILSVNFGPHDMSAVVAKDYKILSAIQAERISRAKSEGSNAYRQKTINEALRIAGVSLADVDVFAVPRCFYNVKYLVWPWHHRVIHFARNCLGLGNRERWLSNHYKRFDSVDYRKAFKADKYMASLGLSSDTTFFDYNHHFAHALPTLFHTDWEDNALLFTADGGGDWFNYSAHQFADGKLVPLYGGVPTEIPPNIPTSSVGVAYSYMTQALGYRLNRHEGKLTGLAAYGEPVLYDKLIKRFTVSEDGLIQSDFKSYDAMREFIFFLADGVKPADCAASAQKVLEETILKSISIYLQRTRATKIGLSGGIFANVSLNRRVGELPNVTEVFVFPAMGDEGIAIGGLYEFLLNKDGLEKWLGVPERKRLESVYWGDEFDAELGIAASNHPDVEVITVADIAGTTARLLAKGKIVALYTGRMEFGPRALGGRSILANPADKAVNDTLNDRLSRTEFMPFAPYVLEQDAEDVFEVTDINRYTMHFMTITCRVKDKWRDRIPAVVHVDGTARPQIINPKDNPLYADILKEFRAETGLPVLINTSFNAHEEPIIYKPDECLKALCDGRVDCIVSPTGIYQKRAVQDKAA